MISQRTIFSFAQFLELQDTAVSVILISKYGAHVSLTNGQPLFGLLNALRGIGEHALMQILAEVVATNGDLRARVNPKYRFEERMEDLTKCLLLDGYIVQGKKLLQSDPSITDAAPLEDDLITALQNSGAPHSQDIIARINASSESFRSTPPDYNASLVSVRVALETLAGDVAAHIASQMFPPPSYNASKWGDVIAFLRKANEITTEEERGLVGVFGFLSPGAHRSIGIPEDQMTRLGRSLALNMCWFLLKNHRG